MTSKELTRLCDDLKKLQDKVENAIFQRMDVIARRMKLDQMIFGLASHYERGGREIGSKQLDKLDYLYCDTIHQGGFQGAWTKEDGWV